jgi:stress response protein YsnF
MAQTVIGFFDDASDAQRAVEQLQSRGISRDRIDVSRGSAGTGTAGAPGTVGHDTHDPNTVRTTSDGRTVDTEGRNTNRITDFFNSLFGGSDKNDADRYSRVAERAGAIVTVHAQSEEEAERAADILDDAGAVDVDERSASYGYTDTRSTDRGARQDTSGEREVAIPRIEENLEVGKRTEERGGVRVRSRIVERPVEEHLRLREENVHVEREPVNRPVSGEDLANFREGEIELTERAEVPVVNKEARVVEEVRVTKDVTEHDEAIRDTVRKTDVDVENIDRGTRDTNKDVDDDLEDEDNPRGGRVV